MEKISGSNFNIFNKTQNIFLCLYPSREGCLYLTAFTSAAASGEPLEMPGIDVTAVLSEVRLTAFRIS